MIVPTRNSARTLRECLLSIRNQRYDTIDVVVVDNGSTDATYAIGCELADVVIAAGSERSAQRNAGAAATSGGYLLMIDSDMVLAPEVVSECVETAERSGAAGIVIPEVSVGTGYWALCKALERSCYIGDDTVEAARFFTREAFDHHGGYDERMTGPEDFDLPARMRAAGHKIERVTAVITHLEGNLRLRDTMAKKFYYGSHLGPYVGRHGGLARAPAEPAATRVRAALASLGAPAGIRRRGRRAQAGRVRSRRGRCDCLVLALAPPVPS